jgi:hypothetical protein
VHRFFLYVIFVRTTKQNIMTTNGSPIKTIAKPSKPIAERVRNVMESPLTYILVLLLTLLSNITHVVSEYRTITGDQSLLPYSFLIVLDLAVIIFAYNGQKKATIIFALILFLLNLSFFTRELALNWNHTREIIVSILLSAAFSYAIFSFSELFVQRVQQKPKKREENTAVINILERLQSPETNKAELAEFVGVSKQYIYQLANEKKTLSDDMKSKMYPYFCPSYI